MFGESDPNNPGLPVKLTSAAVAGFTAAAFSLPFDMLKSRLQVCPRQLLKKMCIHDFVRVSVAGVCDVHDAYVP